MDPRGRQRGRMGPGGRQRERWGPGGGQKGKQGYLGEGPGASVPCAPTGQSSCWFHSVLWNCPNILIDTLSVFGCLLPFPQMRTRESHPREECPAHSIATCCQAGTRRRRSSHRHLGDQTGRTTGQQLSVKAGPPLFSVKGELMPAPSPYHPIRCPGEDWDPAARPRTLQSSQPSET